MKNILLMLVVSGSAIIGFVPDSDDSAESQFVHSVYFWLKDEVTDEQKADFLESLRSLKKIESVEKLELGVPAGTPREVVDNSYDVALLVYFEDQDGHDSYQEDPVHKASIALFSDWIKEIQIYDAICE